MSKVLLKDIAGGQRFIERCADAVRDLSLFFVGAPDAEITAALDQTRANLEADLTETVGGEVAAQIAEAFTKAVIGRKHELEATAGKSGQSVSEDHLASTAQAARIGLSAVGSVA